MPDYHSQEKVARVFSNGMVKLVFPPPEELSSKKWAGISQVIASPSQQKIAFSQNNDLWIYDLEKREKTRLTNIGKPYTKKFASVEVSIKQWSWDESKILYFVAGGDTEDPEGYSPTLKVRPAEYGFHVYNLKTASSSMLPPHITGGFIVAWLENGDFVLDFPSSGNTDRIYQGEFVRYRLANESDTTSLSEQFIGSDPGQVDITRDGRWLVFDNASWKHQSSELLKLNLKTRETISITPVGGWAEYQWPKFSPSGNRIAYSHQTGRKEHIPMSDLVVDGKAIYSYWGYERIYWIDDSSLALVVGNFKTMILTVVDANTGAVRSSEEWKP